MAERPILWEIMPYLKKLQDLTTVSIRWVKAHREITGNIVADLLAQKEMDLA